MHIAHWLRRFLLAFVIALPVIAGAQWVKGHDLAYSLTQGLVWAGISSLLFVGAGIRAWRQKRQCALCALPPSS